MASNVAVYDFDSLGRLISVIYPNGGMAAYNYDEMGNRTTVTEVPAGSPPGPPTVAALPKLQQGDFKNSAMMVLLSNGKLVGWGSNTTGALANGVMTATSSPAQEVLFNPNSTPPPLDATIVDWAFTNANLYVVYSNGWVYAAGANDYGQLGLGDTISRPYLTRIEYFPQNNVLITGVWASGAYGTTNGGGCVYFQSNNYTLYGCGANSAGNLGNASTPISNISTPAPCAGVSNSPNYVTSVVTSCVNTSFSTYLLFNNGDIAVAGYNGQGQLGNGTETNVTGAFETTFTDVAIGVFANGGDNGSIYGGNALAITSVGGGSIRIYGTGYNAHAELGVGDTTNRNSWTTTTEGGTDLVFWGGGVYGYGAWVASSGVAWGYNGQNNLYQGNPTTPVIFPSMFANQPSDVLDFNLAVIPKGNYLSSNAQLFLFYPDNGLISYAGVDNGQVGISSLAYPGQFKYLPTPIAILNKTETVSDVFAHGYSTSQRIFILSNLGKLYACGSNVNSICTGGIASETPAANVEWYQICFEKFQ